MQIKSNDRVFIVGKTGSGKTTLAKKMLYPMYNRRVYWDIKHMNSDLLSCSSLATTPQELAASFKNGKQSILYQPRDIHSYDFNQVCEIIYNLGNCALFVDEAFKVCSPAWIEPWHEQIMTLGRERNVGIINLTQRPRRCHNTVISEAEHFFVFRLQLDTDIQKVKEILPSEYVKQVSSLPYHHCIYTDNNENYKFLAPIRLS